MTKSIDYVFGTDAPAGGTMREVAPGIHWLRMPLPFKLDHINLWVLEDGDGWTLVDTGLANDLTKSVWADLFAGPLNGRPVKRMIVTHFHPDHMGLAGWFDETRGLPLWCTANEWSLARALAQDSGDHPGWARPFRAFYQAAGFNDNLLDLVARRANPYPKRVSMIPNAFRRLMHGMDFDINGRSWQVIVGTGHSPEHACLYCRELDLLISGDQILPRISPNISVWPQEPEADPLRLFLRSLDRFTVLPAGTLVLPSHDWPFKGLRARLDQLAHHHDARLDDVVWACAETQTAYQVLKVLFDRKLDEHQLFFAIGESLAHLHYLEGRGRLTRVDDNGVHRFIAVE